MEDQDKEAVKSPSITTAKTEEHSKVILKNMTPEKKLEVFNWYAHSMNDQLKKRRMFLVLLLILMKNWQSLTK